MEKTGGEVKVEGKSKPEEKNKNFIIYVAVNVAVIGGVVGLVMWQLGFFNLDANSAIPTATGFAKIKPQLAGTSMKADGTFSSVLTNGVGATIKLEEITLTNTVTGSACELDFSSSVAAGENFRVDGRGCGGGRQGDDYAVQMRINYSSTVGRVTTKHTEIGTIRGPIE